MPTGIKADFFAHAANLNMLVGVLDGHCFCATQLAMQSIIGTLSYMHVSLRLVMVMAPNTALLRSSTIYPLPGVYLLRRACSGIDRLAMPS